MQGTLFVLSAPSGAGKTSLVKALLERDPQIQLSVSHTTRLPRVGEEQGVHYHFVSVEEFESLLSQQQFIEHAKVFDNYYGTSKLWLQQRLEAGQDVLLEIDWQGAAQIRQYFERVCSIFIVPPSLIELRRRLTGRNQDSEAVIERRLAEAQAEMAHWQEFDYLIINDQFDRALTQLQSVIEAYRLQSSIQAERYKSILAALTGSA